MSISPFFFGKKPGSEWLTRRYATINPREPKTYFSYSLTLTDSSGRILGEQLNLPYPGGHTVRFSYRSRSPRELVLYVKMTKAYGHGVGGTTYPIWRISGRQLPVPYNKGNGWYILSVNPNQGSLALALSSLARRASVSFQNLRRGFTKSPRVLRPNESRNGSFTGHEWSSSNPGSQSNPVTTYNFYTRTWTGSRTPNFARVKKAALPVNPHTVYIRETFDGGNLSVRDYPAPHVSTTSYHKFNTLWSPPAEPSHESELVNMAIKRLANNAKAGISGNVALTLAQMGQFNRMVATTARRLVLSVRSLKRLNFSAAADALWAGRQPVYRPGGGPKRTNSLAQNWLELQYGWKPLLSDVREASEALARFNLANSSWQQVRSSATRRTKTYVPIVYVINSQAFVWGGFSVSYESSVKYGLRYRLSSAKRALMAQTGFTNPINLGWELIPFSFVVDWFLPIGSYLESLSDFDGFEFVDGFQTRFTKQNVYGQTNAQHFPNAGTIPNGKHWMYGSWTRNVVLLNRGKLTSFPSQIFPSIRNGLNLQRALNGLALLKVVFR